MDTRTELAQSLKLKPEQVQKVLELLAEGGTIPFIARYRKEATGSLDEVAIGAIRDLAESIDKREARRTSILESIQEQGKLNPELEQAIKSAKTLGELEDLYLPYRQKRKTRASQARERGLEPLADLLWQGKLNDPAKATLPFLAPDKGVADSNAALSGAQDILAERFAENPQVRGTMRQIFAHQSFIETSLAPSAKDKPEAATFTDYFSYREKADKAPSHRLLAVLRGLEQGILRVSVCPDQELALKNYQQSCLGTWLRSNPVPASRALVQEALEDSYKRLLAPSLETEITKALKETADKEAIRVFATNLSDMLLDPPFGSKPVLALDPGFRTGCKVAALNASGDILDHGVVYPLEPQRRVDEAALIIRGLIKKHGLMGIALGNGTGGREMESFLGTLNLGIPILMVNESGASIYSAGEIAREEFPDLDLTVRSAVSIGRRLMDPLSELVKIDPKSIGVGQYQHDVDQKELKKGLDETVASCVNSVGVELNTASPWLLSYVSGLSPRLAKSVVAWRKAHGPFKSRADLLKVGGLGPKAFEQCAGFLRIRDGLEVLDKSAVHPESYALVRSMAQACKVSHGELLGNQELIATLRPEAFVTKDAGLPTIKDILEELKKPGRDPRSSFTVFSFDQNVHTIEDLAADMVLPGIVTNVAAFGAFVDIGVHTNGLVHVSEASDRYIKDPHEVLKPGQKVRVRVLAVDKERKRISLSLKNVGQ